MPTTSDDSGTTPLFRALVLLGDMWTLRIVMLVFNGRRRFQDLRTGLSISDPVLSRRLNSLVDDGILSTREYQTNPPRREYLLTDAGLDLWSVLVALWSWDRRWAGPHHRDAHVHLVHTPCGHKARPVFGCGACGAIGVGLHDFIGHVDVELLQDSGRKRSRRSPSMTTPIDGSGVLGDRWSTLLLSDAFTGTRRFNDFQSNLGISPVTLTQRLALFVDSGLMQREEIGGGKRQEYRLTPKALDFFGVTSTINGWAERWMSADGVHTGLTLTHTPCQQRLQPQFTCNACNGVLARREIRFEGQITGL